MKLCLLALTAVFVGNLALVGCSKNAGHSKQAVTTAEPETARHSEKQLTIEKGGSDESLKRASREEVIAHLKAMPVSGTAIGYYLDKHLVAEGVRPKQWALFRLVYMQVIQKAPGGYLLQCNLPGEGVLPNTEYAFLRTDRILPENHHFLDYSQWAISDGTYKYQARNGFDREILSFVMLPDWANDAVNERMGGK